MREPINERAELAVLGAMLNDEKALYEVLSEVDGDHFSSDERIKIYDTIVSLSEGGRVTDKMVLNKLSGAKEKALVRTTQSVYEDYLHFKHDMEELKDSYIKRQLYYITKQALEQTQLEESGIKIADMVSSRLGQLYYDDTGNNIIDPKERAVEGLTEFIEGLDNPDANYGLRFSIPTKNGGYVGFPGLDQALMGAQKGDLILIAAETGVGKTALGVNIARNFSIFQSHAGYYANTEMRKREMEARVLSPVAKATAKEIMFSQLEGSEAERDMKVQRVSDAYERYRLSDLYLSRIPTLSIPKLKGLAKQVKMKYGKLEFILLDYIQRLDLEYMPGDKEHNALKRAAMRLKELAVELDVPIIMLGQRNFEGNIEGGKAIANECDAVLYFEPIDDKDREHIDQTFLNADKRQKVNYKLTKKKVRRDDNPYPLYCNFDKKYQFINEITTG